MINCPCTTWIMWPQQWFSFTRRFIIYIPKWKIFNPYFIDFKAIHFEENGWLRPCKSYSEGSVCEAYNVDGDDSHNKERKNVTKIFVKSSKRNNKPWVWCLFARLFLSRVHLSSFLYQNLLMKHGGNSLDLFFPSQFFCRRTWIWTRVWPMGPTTLA